MQNFFHDGLLFRLDLSGKGGRPFARIGKLAKMAEKSNSRGKNTGIPLGGVRKRMLRTVRKSCPGGRFLQSVRFLGV